LLFITNTALKNDKKQQKLWETKFPIFPQEVDQSDTNNFWQLS